MTRRSVAYLISGIIAALTSLDAPSQTHAAELPDGGPGKELVSGTCTACQDNRQILRSSGYTADGWRELTGTMIDLSASPADQDVLMRYLAEHFSPNIKRAAKLMAGDAQIEFKEWPIEGWHINHKKTERFWQEEGLQLPHRHRKRKRLYHKDSSIIRLRPTHSDHMWSTNFIHDKLSNEVLNTEWFSTTDQAQIVINQWLRHYNHTRSHKALDMRPPVPGTVFKKV